MLLTQSTHSSHQMCVATVTGQSFLRNQVRFMMAVLFLIGRGLEAESIIPHMLDIQLCPCRPMFRMAPPEPLILFDSIYEGLEWEWDGRKSKTRMLNQFQKMMTQQTIRFVLASCM